MDITFIFIIVVSTVLAIVFKWVLYRKIQNWIDQDLITSLANDNAEKRQFLQKQYHALIDAKVKRAEYRRKLSQLAEEFEQKN